MKITKSKLRQIIKEELLKEADTRRFVQVQRPKGITQPLPRAPLPTKVWPNPDAYARVFASQDDPDYGRQEEPDIKQAQRYAKEVVEGILDFSEKEYRGVHGGDTKDFLNYLIFVLEQKKKRPKDPLEKGDLSAKDHEDRAFNAIIQTAINKLEKQKNS